MTTWIPSGNKAHRGRTARLTGVRRWRRFDSRVCSSVHGAFLHLSTPTQMIGSVFLLFLVTGFFGFGDDGAFLFCGMLPAVPVALCVCVCGRERSVGRGVWGGQNRGRGWSTTLPASHRRLRDKYSRLLFPRAHVKLLVVKTVAFHEQIQGCPKSVHGGESGA